MAFGPKALARGRGTEVNVNHLTNSCLLFFFLTDRDGAGENLGFWNNKSFFDWSSAKKDRQEVFVPFKLCALRVEPLVSGKMTAFIPESLRVLTR